MKKQEMQNLPGLVCALFMLCVLPLLFRNAFFDINRFKVSAVRIVVPVLGAISALLCLLLKVDKKRFLPRDAADWSILLFAAACLISSGKTGFEEATLTGSEGRYCGLWMMLSCALAYYLIAKNTSGHTWIGALAVLSAALAGLLGCANAFGFDPLGFYTRLSSEQRSAFISTIGNINFFGVYMAMLLPLAISLWLFSAKTFIKKAGLLCAAAMALGVLVSRTDSAYLGMQTVFLAMFALCGDRYDRLARVLALWAFSWLMLPVSKWLMLSGQYQLATTGLAELLCSTHLAEIVGFVLAALALIAGKLARAGAKPIGKRRLVLICAALFFAALSAMILLIVLFTVVFPDVELGSAAAFLRFDDNWGSARGFVFKRSLAAFSDASLFDKLFGQGLDLARRILKPYDDNPNILVTGVFTDAHCQPLQLLITCGLFGAISFCAFQVFVFSGAARWIDKDPLICGCLISLCGYWPMMCISVTQPILMTTLFSLCGFVQARAYEHRMKEGGHES